MTLLCPPETRPSTDDVSPVSGLPAKPDGSPPLTYRFKVLVVTGVVALTLSASLGYPRPFRDGTPQSIPRSIPR